VDAIDRVLAGEQLLRQRRSRVGQVALLADHHELAVEPGLTRCLRRPQPGQTSRDILNSDLHAAQVAKLKSVRCCNDARPALSNAHD